MIKNIKLAVITAAAVLTLSGCDELITAAPLGYNHTFDEFTGFAYRERGDCGEGLYVEEAGERTYNLYEYAAPGCDTLQASLEYVYTFEAVPVSAPLGSGKAYRLNNAAEPERKDVFNIYENGYRFRGRQYVRF